MCDDDRRKTGRSFSIVSVENIALGANRRDVTFLHRRYLAEMQLRKITLKSSVFDCSRPGEELRRGYLEV